MEGAKICKKLKNAIFDSKFSLYSGLTHQPCSFPLL